MALSHSNVTHHTDVLIVGAGVLGTFYAYFAAKAGRKVALLERNLFPQAASTRNFGMLVQTIVETETEWATFARRSRDIYQTIQQEHDITVRHSGSLYLASTPAKSHVLQEFAQLHDLSYHCTYLSSEDACARYPFIRPEYCTGALLFPDDLTLEPQQMLKKLISVLANQGSITYFPQTTVVEIESRAHHCSIRDARGNLFTAQQVVICSGAEYRTLFPEHFKLSGLRVCKLQMMQTIPQGQTVLPHSILSGLSIQRYPAFRSCPSFPSLAEQSSDPDLQRYGVHLLFKQAHDGTVIIGDSHEYSEIADETLREETTSMHIQEIILQYGKRMLALPTWSIQTMWNGYYLQHPSRPVYTAQVAHNIHIVTGIAGKGMSTGPGFVQAHIRTLLI